VEPRARPERLLASFDEAGELFGHAIDDLPSRGRGLVAGHVTAEEQVEALGALGGEAEKRFHADLGQLRER
jgi:hypothetical protein